MIEQDLFTSERLVQFHEALAGMGHDELKKARILYLKNALSNYNAMKKSYDGLRLIHWPMGIIPIFWPIIYLQRKHMRAAEELLMDKIKNTIVVWELDETNLLD